MKRKKLIFVIIAIFIILSLLINITSALSINIKGSIINDNEKIYDHPKMHQHGKTWCQIQGKVCIKNWGNWDVNHEVFVCGYTDTDILYENGETIWVDIDLDSIDDFTAYIINFQGSDYTYEGPVNLSLLNNDYKIIKVKDYSKAGKVIEVEGFYNTIVVEQDKAINIDILVKKIENRPPETPINRPPETPTLTGTEFGRAGSSNSYTVKSIDPDNNQIYYMFDWDVETESQWYGPYESDEDITIKHTWSENGLYNIKVKAKDEHGLESSWSDTFNVNMPKMRYYNFLRVFIQSLLIFLK